MKRVFVKAFALVNRKMSCYALGLIVLIFAVSASLIQAKSISNKNDRAGAFYYLNKYGYLPKDANKQTAALMSDDAITTAVKDFQVPCAGCFF